MTTTIWHGPTRSAGLVLGTCVIWILGTIGLAYAVNSTETSSDVFWTADSRESISAESYDDLIAMRDAADAVVVGRVIDVSVGRSFVADPALGEDGIARHVLLIFAVERAIHGTFGSGDRVQLEIFVRSKSAMEEMLGNPPLDRTVLFLRNKGIEAKALGFGQAYVAAESPFYRLVNRTQGAIREIEGRVAPLPSDESEFLAELAGGSFETLLETLGRPG
jgi:hypothetical protein